MAEQPTMLNRLYAQFDATTNGRDTVGNSSTIHAAIVDRLNANRRGAEAGGWSACALERDGGSGRLRLICVAPGENGRREVPDAV